MCVFVLNMRAGCVCLCALVRVTGHNELHDFKDLSGFWTQQVSDLDATFRFQFLRYLWSGKFIIAVIIFGRYFIYIYIYSKGSVKYVHVVISLCREQAKESAEIDCKVFHVSDISL